MGYVVGYKTCKDCIEIKVVLMSGRYSQLKVVFILGSLKLRHMYLRDCYLS